MLVLETRPVEEDVLRAIAENGVDTLERLFSQLGDQYAVADLQQAVSRLIDRRRIRISEDLSMQKVAA